MQQPALLSSAAPFWRYASLPYCTAMALCGVVVCRATTAIRGVIFSRAAMAIGGVVFFSLTATGIRGVVFPRGTLVVGIAIFRRATLLFVICRTTTAIRGKHNNPQKEGCVAKICLTAVMDDCSVGGNDGKDASATTAMMPVQQGRWLAWAQ